MGICILPQEIVVPSSGPPKGKTLDEYSWEEISYISSNGLAGEYGFAVGDEKNITLSTDEALTLAIMGFDHDELADGTGYAGITFGMKNLMKNTRQMNSTNTNSGGFTGSAMYTWLQGELLNSLPSDLQTVIKMVNKKTSAGNESTTINTDAMNLFLFSEQEIFGAKTYSVGNEGTQYSYFDTAGNRVKYFSTGVAGPYWERSPNARNSKNFCDVKREGSAHNYYASYSYGVCFGFCV